MKNATDLETTILRMSPYDQDAIAEARKEIRKVLFDYGDLGFIAFTLITQELITKKDL